MPCAGVSAVTPPHTHTHTHTSQWVGGVNETEISVLAIKETSPIPSSRTVFTTRQHHIGTSGTSRWMAGGWPVDGRGGQEQDGREQAGRMAGIGNCIDKPWGSVWPAARGWRPVRHSNATCPTYVAAGARAAAPLRPPVSLSAGTAAGSPTGQSRLGPVRRHSGEVAIAPEWEPPRATRCPRL